MRGDGDGDQGRWNVVVDLQAAAMGDCLQMIGVFCAPGVSLWCLDYLFVPLGTIFDRQLKRHVSSLTDRGMIREIAPSAKMEQRSMMRHTRKPQ